MSHTDRCPDRWTAQREGERAQEQGYGRFRNPYEDIFSRERCDEAAQEWSAGYRRAEMREEEQREEEASRRRAAHRRIEADEEACYFQRQQEEAEYYAMQQETYLKEDLRAAEAAQAESKAEGR